ncbi:hypothetical protein WUBG_17771, partial [Wuchereria bancrofti]
QLHNFKSNFFNHFICTNIKFFLFRSQGTLSDLLRNPKPWSKLKSGRETFRRMAKWLQEPEFQRMSALRLAENRKKERKF